MIGIYLSGTGNTKHCVEKLVNLLDDTARCIPLETPYIINMLENENTMGLFSGDGTGCTARLLKKYGAEILGGLQIKMPDSVCDSKLLKKGIEENRQIVKNADKRIEQTAEQIKRGIYPKEGLSFIAHIKGLFGQRLWFYRKTIYYTDKLKISDSCIGCGLCSKECPMKNIKMKENRAVPGKRCTMCYRCISLCPQKAITLLGKRFRNNVDLKNTNEKAEIIDKFQIEQKDCWK